MSPSSPTTLNSSPNSVAILVLLIQKEKPKRSSRTSICMITKGSPSIWLSLIGWLLGCNGEMLYFNASSITDFCPRSRMKFPGLGNPAIFRTYEPCHWPLMPNTGNADLKLLEKLQQKKTWLTRRSRTTRVKQHLTLRPRPLQTRRIIVEKNLAPPDPIQPTFYMHITMLPLDLRDKSWTVNHDPNTFRARLPLHACSSPESHPRSFVPLTDFPSQLPQRDSSPSLTL